MKYQVQIIFGIASATRSSSESFVLVVFNIYSMGAVYIVPFPRLMHKPDLLFISSCTTNDALTHHSMTPFLFIASINDINFVYIKYVIIIASFF